MFLDLNRLKAERIARKLQQKDVANELGWSIGKYTKIENGYSKLGSDDLAKIADVLGIEDMNIFFNFSVVKLERKLIKEVI